MHTAAPASLVEIIEAKSIPEPNSGCWLWLGYIAVSRSPHYLSYGRLGWNGRSYPAHRLSWLAHRGPIPGGMVVMHKCDNPGCVNPEHLKLGTHQENMADMVNKGRQGRLPGAANGRAKLSAEQVREIRASTLDWKALGSQYGVHPETIIKIRAGRRWKNV
jgi:hypothetical protein